MRFVSVAQMRELESQANAGDLSYDRMMARAGKGLADAVHNRYWAKDLRSVLGLVGSGNNGGDTLVALTHLKHEGWSVKAYIVNERDKNDLLISAYLAAAGGLADVSADVSFRKLKIWVKESDVILDGILGTGISLPLRGTIPAVLSAVSSVRSNPVIVAVDCPSGVDCDSGASAEECLKADLTVCMAAVKQGLLKYPAHCLVGDLAVVDIGLPKSLPAWKEIKGEVMTSQKATALLPRRPEDAHKGIFGTCLVVSGSVNYCGAALLASEAAYRVGVGLVRVAIPGAIYDAIAGRLPEATWLVLPHTDGVINADAAGVIRRNLDRVTAMLVGPGLGFETPTQDFVSFLIDKTDLSDSSNRVFGFTDAKREEKKTRQAELPPLVIDADGLRLLAQVKDWPRKLGVTAVLTPHPGEMAALAGLPVDEIQNNRIEVALEYAQKWGHVVVLKGALTVTADPSGKYTVNPVATSALATAGTGDVLAGMITGLIAQGLAGYSAAITGVWLHAQAGILAAEQLGGSTAVTARDVLAAIPAALKTTTGIQN
ncbi:MAG: NAD(P)H-hydrate dehydratase [Pelolinea sp.]|nr:NAD(P)H-hydrate dehydratase [Pelolinea sp.]